MKVSFTAIRQTARRRWYFQGARDAVRGYTKDFLERVVEEVRPYAPPIPDSKYVRTMELFGSWQVKNTSRGNSIAYGIVNNARDPKKSLYYANIVQGSQQLAIHRSHGWRTVQDVLASMGGRERFRRGVQAILTRSI